jgi:hypothetical protein
MKEAEATTVTGATKGDGLMSCTDGLTMIRSDDLTEEGLIGVRMKDEERRERMRALRGQQETRDERDQMRFRCEMASPRSQIRMS